jgi:hypothetical protein
MARLASLARAGYYPFLAELLPTVAARLDWRAWIQLPEPVFPNADVTGSDSTFRVHIIEVVVAT